MAGNLRPVNQQHQHQQEGNTMDPKQLLKLILWLAALGGLVLFGSRIVGQVSAKVPA